MEIYEVLLPVPICVEASSQEEAEALVARAAKENGIPVIEYKPGRTEEEAGLLLPYDEA